MNDSKLYELENVRNADKDLPRSSKLPTAEEIKNLGEGAKVELVFLLPPASEEEPGCREKMWVEIQSINGDQFVGYLINQPRSIECLNIGDSIEFRAQHIASVPPGENHAHHENFDLTQTAFISVRSLEEKFINWLYREQPINSKDSGWRLFIGDEKKDYINDPENHEVITLEKVLDIEPLIEDLLEAPVGTEYEWSEIMLKYVKVSQRPDKSSRTNKKKWWEFWK